MPSKGDVVVSYPVKNPSVTMGTESKRQLNTGKTNLMAACEQGRALDVKIILQKKTLLIGSRDRNGKTALHYCAESGSLPCAQQVVTADSTLVNAQDNEGFTPLHLSVIAGHRSMVKFLIKYGADINCVDKERHSCVHWASVCGDVETLDILLSSGADSSTADVLGAYPIHYAAQMCGPNSLMGNDPRVGLNILKKLVKRGASVQCRDRDGREPLLWAASAGSSEAILLLFSSGANIAAADKDGLTALHCAASRGHTSCVETLVTLCGSKVNGGDALGCTPLFYAAAQGHADCAHMLLKYGAEPNFQDTKGRTASHCAATRGQLETMRILDTNGGDLWMRNSRGNLAIHEAVQSGRKDLVQWLLQQRPEAVNASNISGRTPLHIAAEYNNVEMCEVLIEYGAFINPLMVNTKGFFMTPLDVAVHQGNQRCAKFIHLHGGIPATKILENSEIDRDLLFSLGTQACSRRERSDDDLVSVPSADNNQRIGAKTVTLLKAPRKEDVATATENTEQELPESDKANGNSEDPAAVHIHLTSDDLWSLWESLMKGFASEDLSECSPRTDVQADAKDVRKRGSAGTPPRVANVYLKRVDQKSAEKSEGQARDRSVRRTAGSGASGKDRRSVTEYVVESIVTTSNNHELHHLKEIERDPDAEVRCTCSSHASGMDSDDKLGEKTHELQVPVADVPYLSQSVGSDTEEDQTQETTKPVKLRKKKSNPRHWGKTLEESETSSGHKQEERPRYPYLKRLQQRKQAKLEGLSQEQLNEGANQSVPGKRSRERHSNKESIQRNLNVLPETVEDASTTPRLPDIETAPSVQKRKLHRSRHSTTRSKEQNEIESKEMEHEEAPLRNVIDGQQPGIPPKQTPSSRRTSFPHLELPAPAGLSRSSQYSSDVSGVAGGGETDRMNPEPPEEPTGVPQGYHHYHHHSHHHHHHHHDASPKQRKATLRTSSLSPIAGYDEEVEEHHQGHVHHHHNRIRVSHRSPEIERKKKKHVSDGEFPQIQTNLSRCKSESELWRRNSYDSNIPLLSNQAYEYYRNGNHFEKLSSNLASAIDSPDVNAELASNGHVLSADNVLPKMSDNRRHDSGRLSSNRRASVTDLELLVKQSSAERDKSSPDILTTVEEKASSEATYTVPKESKSSESTKSDNKEGTEKSSREHSSDKERVVSDSKVSSSVRKDSLGKSSPSDQEAKIPYKLFSEEQNSDEAEPAPMIIIEECVKPLEDNSSDKSTSPDVMPQSIAQEETATSDDIKDETSLSEQRHPQDETPAENITRSKRRPSIVHQDGMEESNDILNDHEGIFTEIQENETSEGVCDLELEENIVEVSDHQETEITRDDQEEEDGGEGDLETTEATISAQAAQKNVSLDNGEPEAKLSPLASRENESETATPRIDISDDDRGEETTVAKDRVRSAAAVHSRKAVGAREGEVGPIKSRSPAEDQSNTCRPEGELLGQGQVDAKDEKPASRLAVVGSKTSKLAVDSDDRMIRERTFISKASDVPIDSNRAKETVSKSKRKAVTRESQQELRKGPHLREVRRDRGQGQHELTSKPSQIPKVSAKNEKGILTKCVIPARSQVSDKDHFAEVGSPKKEAASPRVEQKHRGVQVYDRSAKVTETKKVYETKSPEKRQLMRQDKHEKTSTRRYARSREPEPRIVTPTRSTKYGGRQRKKPTYMEDVGVQTKRQESREAERHMRVRSKDVVILDRKSKKDIGTQINGIDSIYDTQHRKYYESIRQEFSEEDAHSDPDTEQHTVHFKRNLGAIFFVDENAEVPEKPFDEENLEFKRLNEKGELTVFCNSMNSASRRQYQEPRRSRANLSNLDKPGFLWVHFGSTCSPTPSLKKKPKLTSETRPNKIRVPPVKQTPEKIPSSIRPRRTVPKIGTVRESAKRNIQNTKTVKDPKNYLKAKSNISGKVGAAKKSMVKKTAEATIRGKKESPPKGKQLTRIEDVSHKLEIPIPEHKDEEFPPSKVEEDEKKDETEAEKLEDEETETLETVPVGREEEEEEDIMKEELEIAEGDEEPEEVNVEEKIEEGAAELQTREKETPDEIVWVVPDEEVELAEHKDYDSISVVEDDESRPKSRMEFVDNDRQQTRKSCLKVNFGEIPEPSSSETRARQQQHGEDSNEAENQADQGESGDGNGMNRQDSKSTCKSSSPEEGEMKLVIQRKIDPEFKIRINMTDPRKDKTRKDVRKGAEQTQHTDSDRSSLKDSSGYVSAVESVYSNRRNFKINFGHTTAKIDAKLPKLDHDSTDISSGIVDPNSDDMDSTTSFGKRQLKQTDASGGYSLEAPEAVQYTVYSTPSWQEPAEHEALDREMYRRRSIAEHKSKSELPRVGPSVEASRQTKMSTSPRRESLPHINVGHPSYTTKYGGRIRESHAETIQEESGPSSREQTTSTTTTFNGPPSTAPKPRVRRNSGIPIARTYSETSLRSPSNRKDSIEQSKSMPSLREEDDTRVKMNIGITVIPVSRESNGTDGIKLPEIVQVESIKKSPSVSSSSPETSLPLVTVSPAEQSKSSRESYVSNEDLEKDDKLCPKLPLLQTPVRCRCIIHPNKDTRRIKSAVECVAEVKFLTEEELKILARKALTRKKPRFAHSCEEIERCNHPFKCSSLKTQTLKRLRRAKKDSKDAITFHVDHQRERNTFKLPTEQLKKNKKWQVVFTIAKSQLKKNDECKPTVTEE